MVEVGAGRYELPETWLFTPEDSGTEKAPIIYRAAKGASPVISGGRAVRNWKVGADGRWTAQVAELLKGIYPQQMTVNGERRYRSRLPKEGLYRIAGLAGAKAFGPLEELWASGSNKFEYRKGDIDPAWRNLSDIRIVIQHFWIDEHMPIQTIDADTCTLISSGKTRCRLTESWGKDLARYYVNNVQEALSLPGEWYLERRTGVLQYLPKSGEAPSSAEVVLAALSKVLEIRGDLVQGQAVHHLTFSGLTFSDAHWTFPVAPGAITSPSQSANAVPASVVLSGAQHIVFDACRFIHSENYGLELLNGVFDCRINHCEFAHQGAGGIRLTGGGVTSPENERNGRHVVTDNHLHHLGEFYPSAAGILSQISFGNTISHNHLHHINHNAISVGWQWGYAPSVVRDNRIEANDIHDIGLAIVNDEAAIYTLGMQPGTIIRGNLIRNIGNKEGRGWYAGIYLDEGTTGVVVEDNTVFNTGGSCFNQHYGKDNIVRNNIFANSLNASYSIGRTKVKGVVSSLQVERNIIITRSGKAMVGGEHLKNLGSEEDKGFRIDSNCYWQAGGEAPLVNGKRMTWTTWRSHGKDLNSLIADPQFADPDHGDFTLKPGSPAVTKLGFKPFDLSQVGPRDRTLQEH